MHTFLAVLDSIGGYPRHGVDIEGNEQGGTRLHLPGWCNEPCSLPWFNYAGTRNISAYTYDGKKANQVFQAAVIFLSDTRRLLEQ